MFSLCCLGLSWPVLPFSWEQPLEEQEPKHQTASEKIREERLNRNFVWCPLWGAGRRQNWESGWELNDWATGGTLQRVCWMLQILLVCSDDCLSFPTSSKALCLISILPLLSTLNLSDYSHTYMATTIYNHLLVYPFLSSAISRAALLFIWSCSFCLTFWYCYYLIWQMKEKRFLFAVVYNPLAKIWVDV